MQKELGFVAIGLSIFDVICICISLGIDYWIYFEDATVKRFSGLWRECFESSLSASTNTCIELKDSTTPYATELKAVRAMLFLGLFFVCGGLVCVVVKLFALKDKKEVLYAAAGIYALAGIFLLIGYAVYLAEIFKPAVTDKNLDDKLHAGFAFCVIAWLVTWGAAGLSGAMTL